MEATITKALEKPKPCITDSVSQYGVAINTCKYIKKKKKKTSKIIKLINVVSM